MASLILASQSPRRQALLRAAGTDFRVVIPNIDEDAHQTEGHPSELAKRTAQAKAWAVADRVALDPSIAGTDYVVIAADTIVHLGEHIFNKPADATDARRMLRELSGKTHTVHTGISFASPAGIYISDSVGADVTFNELSDDFIARYIATGEPMDKAGAYGIQGLGAQLVAAVDGDITAVIGLPMIWLARTIEDVTGEKLTSRPLPDVAFDAFPDLKNLPARCLEGLVNP